MKVAIERHPVDEPDHRIKIFPIVRELRLHLYGAVEDKQSEDDESVEDGQIGEVEQLPGGVDV